MTCRIVGSNATVAVMPAVSTSVCWTIRTEKFVSLATAVVAGSMRIVSPGGGGVGVGLGLGVADAAGVGEPDGAPLRGGVGVSVEQVITVPPTVVTARASP